MSEHTPGPWKYRVSNSNRRIWEIVGPRQEAICSTHLWADKHRNESLANVYLLEAAPELLKALKWAMKQGNLGYATRTKGNTVYCDAVDRAVVAIAKAEGTEA